MEMKNDLYGLYRPGSSGWTSLRNPEFQEADIWEVFRDAKAPNPGAIISLDQDQSLSSKRLEIPKPNKASINHSDCPTTNRQSSAPVNIPDWSKIYGSSSSYKNTFEDSCSWLSADSQDDCCEEEENGNDVIPPHEWIARKVSRSEIFSFSVCEGAGRTLKGRDLSRVRNAVLIKTGFLESNSRFN